ncbi:unnamed protein product [Absidia cylindrospora]
MNSDSIEVVNSHSEEGAFVEVTGFKFRELVVNAKVTMQDVIFKEGEYPATVSLLACSGKYGYFVAGHIDGFVFGQTKRLRTTFYDSEEGATSRLDDKIIVPLQLRSINLINVLEQKKDAQPKQSINFPAPIIDLRPNTGALPDSACVFLQNQQCCIVNWKTGETITDIPVLDLTAICWSPKGKRIICGRENGTLEHYDLDGVKQGTIQPPESLKAGDKNGNVDRRVQDVLWVDNDQFLVIYSRDKDTESDGSINSAYLIDQKPKSGTVPKCTRLAKLPPIVPSDAVYNHYYMETIRDDTQTIIILANGASNIISAVGQDESGNWATWKLSMGGVASLPLSDEVNCCTISLGLALDFAACEKLPPYDATKSSVGVEPFPVLYCINDEGYLGAFHCYNEHLARDGTAYQNMQTAIALPPSPTTSSASPTNKCGTSSTFSPDAFSTAMKSGYSGKDFASLEKVKGATSPIFGNLESSSSPKFGSTTSIGAMSSTSTSSSPLSSPAKPTFDDSTSNSAATTTTDQKHADSLPGPMESSGISVVEHTNSTTSSSSSSTSSGFEMVNKNDCISDDVVPEIGVSSSKSATTNVEDQVVPTETSLSVKKEPDTTSTMKPALTTTSSNKETAPKLHTTSLAANNNKPNVTPSPVTASPTHGFNFGSFRSDKKVPDTTTPNANLSLFGSKPPLGGGNNNMTSFSQLAKMNMPPPSGPTTKKNVPAGTTPTFNDLAKKNAPAGPTLKFDGFGTTNVATGKPSAFGEFANKNAAAGTTPTFGEPAKKNTPAGSTLKFDGFGNTNVPTGRPSAFGEFANKNVPAGTTPTFNDIAKENTPAGPTLKFDGFGNTNVTTGKPSAFGEFAKNNTPAGTTPKFGGFGNTNVATGKPSAFGEFANTNAATGITPTFGEPAKNNTPAGTTPKFVGFGNTNVATGKPSAFGEFSNTNAATGITPTFGEPAKNLPAGTTPKFGGFGNTNMATGKPSAFGEIANKNAAAGITPTFGEPAKKNAPTTMEPLSGFSFGNRTKNTTTSGGKPSFGTISGGIKPPTNRHPTGFLKLQQPAILSSTTKPSTDATKLTSLKNTTQQQEADYEDKSLTVTVETKKPSSDAFDDDSYSKVLQLVDKMAAMQAGFQKQLQSQGDQLDTLVKNMDHLTDNFKKWQSMERDQSPPMKIDSVKHQTSDVSNPDSDLTKTITAKQVLTTTAKDKEITDVDKILAEMQCTINNDSKKGKQKQVDASDVSVDGFRSAIEQMEDELMKKAKDMMELKQRLTLLRFREHQLKARYSQSTIACEDLTDDDDDEDDDKTAELDTEDPTITDANHVDE